MFTAVDLQVTQASAPLGVHPRTKSQRGNCHACVNHIPAVDDGFEPALNRCRLLHHHPAGSVVPGDQSRALAFLALLSSFQKVPRLGKRPQRDPSEHVSLDRQRPFAKVNCSWERAMRACELIPHVDRQPVWDLRCWLVTSIGHTFFHRTSSRDSEKHHTRLRSPSAEGLTAAFAA